MTSREFTRQAPIRTVHSAYPLPAAPFSGHAVSGSSEHLRSGKTTRLRQRGSGSHRAAPVSTGKGTPRGRQAALTPDRKRTASMFGIG